jgi:hypothetical protein
MPGKIQTAVLKIFYFSVLLIFTSSCITINMPKATSDTKTQGDQTTPSTSIEMPTIESFSAFPESVSEGESSTLSWRVRNATSIVITPDIGNVSAAGIKTVTPSAATTYTLEASNAAGIKSRTVVVNITIVKGDQYIISTGKPDLKIMGFSVDVNGVHECLVTNIGTAASNPAIVSLYVNDNLLESREVPAIDPGKYCNVLFVDYNPGNYPKKSKLTMVVDSSNTNDELDENNNSSTMIY